jgi:23S rRNA A2030 N6-methylase RlmJ
MARGVVGTNHLAYHVILSCVEHRRQHYSYVDAHSGVVLNEYNPMHNALSREVNHYASAQRLFTEGDMTPTNLEVKMLVDTVYQQYHIMNNVAGWRSWDLNGTSIHFIFLRK